MRLPKPSERGTEELIIGLVGPIGSGVTTCAEALRDELVNTFGYSSGRIIKVSELIKQHASRVHVTYDSSNPEKHVESLQAAGTKLRNKFGETVVVDLAIAAISEARPKPQKIKQPDGSEIDGPAESRRHFTIIDSLKHPAEVDQLSAVYKDAFWLIGVFAPPAVREDRLRDRFGQPEEIVRAMRIDEDESDKLGQKVAKTIERSDYFIRNDGDSKDELRRSVKRLLNVLFSIGVQTPTKDESSMYAAAAAASKSACMSRQVGAVIVSGAGEIIGTGSNDVPQYGGGLYSNGDKDNRCYRWGGNSCHNDDQKKRLVKDAVSALTKAEILDTDDVEAAGRIIASSRLKSLIEFSRAVHAEMEAIISVARSGATGLVGSTLYSTTFPCHSCARHIVAAGIDRVVYIEPYAKSLALDLHKDAISTSDSDKGAKTTFVQYEGVGPKNYIRLFYNRSERKVDGRAIEAIPGKASPVIKEPLDDFAVRENMATGALNRLKLDDAQPAN